MKIKILIPLLLFHLASCNNTDEQNDASRNKSDGMTSNEMQKDSTTEKKKEFKEKEEIKPPKKIDKKSLILGIWTFTKAGRSRGKMKFTKYGNWYVQKKNNSSWKKEGSYKLSNDLSSISLTEGRNSNKFKLKSYTKNKVVIVVDKNDASDNIILTK